MGLNIELLKSSFEVAKPQANEIVINFYNTLFKDYPEAKSLFKDVNMPKQRMSLINSLCFIVDNLESSEKLVSYLQKMGARHIKYGAQEEHYSWVGASLLKAFSMTLGSVWTKEINDEWANAYQVIAETMIEGARHEEELKSENKSTISHHDSNVIPIKDPESINFNIDESLVKELQMIARKKFQIYASKIINEVYQEELIKLNNEISELIRKKAS